jgi:hypothetical protein
MPDQSLVKTFKIFLTEVEKSKLMSKCFAIRDKTAVENPRPLSDGICFKCWKWTAFPVAFLLLFGDDFLKDHNIFNGHAGALLEKGMN